MSYVEKVLRTFHCDGVDCSAQGEPKSVSDPDALPSDWLRVEVEDNTHKLTRHYCATCAYRTRISDAMGRAR